MPNLKKMLKNESENIHKDPTVGKRNDATDLLISAKFKDGHIHHILPDEKTASEMVEDILGQVDVDPIIAVPLVDTLMDLTIESTQSPDDGQSTDLTVFELFDQNDAPTNTQRIFKTASEELEEALEDVLSLNETEPSIDENNLIFAYSNAVTCS